MLIPFCLFKVNTVSGAFNEKNTYGKQGSSSKSNIEKGYNMVPQPEHIQNEQQKLLREQKLLINNQKKDLNGGKVQVKIDSVNQRKAKTQDFLNMRSQRHKTSRLHSTEEKTEKQDNVKQTVPTKFFDKFSSGMKGKQNVDQNNLELKVESQLKLIEQLKLMIEEKDRKIIAVTKDCQILKDQYNSIRDREQKNKIEKYVKMNKAQRKKEWLRCAKTADYASLKLMQLVPDLGKMAIIFEDDEEKRTVLHYAVLQGHHVMLKDFVRDLSGDIEHLQLITKPDFQGYTVLDLAIENEDYRSFKYLYKLCKQYHLDDRALCHFRSISEKVEELIDSTKANLIIHLAKHAKQYNGGSNNREEAISQPYEFPSCIIL